MTQGASRKRKASLALVCPTATDAMEGVAMSKRATSYEHPKIAVKANASNVRRKAARKQWKPKTKTKVYPFFLDENGNAYVYTDEKGRTI